MPRSPSRDQQANRRETALLDLRPFNTFGHSRFGSLETSTPRHLPSSGFEYPLDGLLPAALGYGPSAATAFMGFYLQGLTPPDPRFPSRGLASLVVPRPRINAKPARLQRFFRNREGERRFKHRTPGKPDAGLIRRTLPSWLFAPPGLSPPSP